MSKKRGNGKREKYFCKIHVEAIDRSILGIRASPHILVPFSCFNLSFIFFSLSSLGKSNNEDGLCFVRRYGVGLLAVSGKSLV
jgi:hypothetical protein